MLNMLDRRAVQKLLEAGLTRRAVAEQFRVSRRTIEQTAERATTVRVLPTDPSMRPNIANRLPV